MREKENLMNKRLFIPVSILIVALLISSCNFNIVVGSGKVTSETRQVDEFSAVNLEGIGDVIITQADTTSVRIEAESDLIPYFETTVKGDTLVIGLKDEFFGFSIRPTKPVKFYVSTPDLKAVTLAGSGNIVTSDVKADAFKASLLGSGNIDNDTLTAASLDINLAGSGNITFGKVTADNITSVIAGSGNIRLGGMVTDQTARIVGSGDYRASELSSKTANIKVTGSGNSQVSVSDTLDVSILGSGDVNYHGSPKLNTSIAGSGHVRSDD
jgi:hypothetical protein